MSSFGLPPPLLLNAEANLALELLWDALDGDGDVQETTKIVRGLPGRRIDDDHSRGNLAMKNHRLGIIPFIGHWLFHNTYESVYNFNEYKQLDIL